MHHARALWRVVSLQLCMAGGLFLPMCLDRHQKAWFQSEHKYKSRMSEKHVNADFSLTTRTTTFRTLRAERSSHKKINRFCYSWTPNRYSYIPIGLQDSALVSCNPYPSLPWLRRHRCGLFAAGPTHLQPTTLRARTLLQGGFALFQLLP